MFGIKKRLKQIEEEKEYLKKEKEELLFIKEQLENTTPKIDISNVFVWNDKNTYSIVRLDVQNIRGKTLGGFGEEVDGFYSTLTDIFTNQIIYEKSSTCKIQSKERIVFSIHNKDNYYAYLYPIYRFDNNLLAFVDKKVPLYILQQLYYELNNIDVNAYTLKKEND